MSFSPVALTRSGQNQSWDKLLTAFSPDLLLFAPGGAGHTSYRSTIRPMPVRPISKGAGFHEKADVQISVQ
jgi:hypothetical protein